MTVLFSSAQFIYKIKADSVLITNDSCNAELNLENSTRHVAGGFLYNKGNGRTEFRKALYKVNDTLYLIGGDSLKIAPPSTGNYILNQNASAQTADYYINGKGSLLGGLSVGAQFNTTNTSPSYYNSYKAQIWDSLLVEGAGASQVRFTGNNPYNPGFIFNGSTSNTSMYTLNSQNLTTSTNGSTYFNNNKIIMINGVYVEPFQQPLTVKKAYPGAGVPITLILDNDTVGTYTSGVTASAYKILSNKYAGNEVSYLLGNGGGVFTEDLTVNTLTIGDGAGTGYQNTALGYQVLSSNTTGLANVGVGNETLKRNTTGMYNAAVGVSSLAFNTTGQLNAAFGVNSLQINTTGGGNTAIGAQTLATNTTGSVNTAIGWNSMGNSSTGNYNTAVGSNASRDVGVAENTCAFGYAALGVNYANNNGAFGALTLFNNTTGIYNNAFGAAALYYNVTGSENVAFGQGALYASTGSYNVALGSGAGYTLTAGDNNIFIGRNVVPNISTTGSNQLNIGGWIYGDNGKIGIGVTGPTAKFNLPAGTSSANTAPLKFISGTNLTTPENGAVEYDGTNYFATSSSTRYTIAKTLTSTASLNFSSTSAQSSADLTITVTGAADGDAVSLGVPNGSVNNNSNYTAWVSASNTVTVRFNNYSSGSIDPASGTFRVSVIKY
jgi:hypothetical protein